MPSKDREKIRQYEREWYKKNKDKRQACNEKWQQKQIAAYQELKKNLFCSFCKESDPVCLEFHHTDPKQKDMAVSVAAARFSTKRLMREIEKCVVLCANCHRKEHAKLKEAIVSSIL